MKSCFRSLFLVVLLVFGTVASNAQTTATHSSASAAVKPSSLIGLRPAQVKAKLGEPSVTLRNVWTYDSLRVYFKNGVVSETRPIAPTNSRSYTNVDGKREQSPTKADAPPAGATARCRDGSYSFSAHRRGTRSHHGGVARWL